MKRRNPVKSRQESQVELCLLGRASESHCSAASVFHPSLYSFLQSPQQSFEGSCQKWGGARTPPSSTLFFGSKSLLLETTLFPNAAAISLICGRSRRICKCFRVFIFHSLPTRIASIHLVYLYEAIMLHLLIICISVQLLDSTVCLFWYSKSSVEDYTLGAQSHPNYVLLNTVDFSEEV